MACCAIGGKSAFAELLIQLARRLIGAQYQSTISTGTIFLEHISSDFYASPFRTAASRAGAERGMPSTLHYVNQAGSVEGRALVGLPPSGQGIDDRGLQGARLPIRQKRIWLGLSAYGWFVLCAWQRLHISSVIFKGENARRYRSMRAQHFPAASRAYSGAACISLITEPFPKDWPQGLAASREHAFRVSIAHLRYGR